MIWIAVLLGAVLVTTALLHWGTRWGTKPAERSRSMAGDEYLQGGPAARVAMTRAVSIDAPPESVWPWIAQLGRGAGWYSIDWLDNGRRTSAQHIVSWIPQPRLGDANAIGYLRHIDAGRTLVWWVDGVRFVGSRARLVTCYELYPERQGTRLVSRMSADARGPGAPLALLVFRAIDSIMASRQLIGIRDRAERASAAVRPTATDPETGARDQYQLYEVIYADGESAAVSGREHAARWRRAATEDGILSGDE